MVILYALVKVCVKCFQHSKISLVLAITTNSAFGKGFSVPRYTVSFVPYISKPLPAKTSFIILANNLYDPTSRIGSLAKALQKQETTIF